MRVVVSQFEGIDATPALPLAAGCLVAAARADERLGGHHYSIEFRRRKIADVLRDFAVGGPPSLLGFSVYPWNAAYSLAVAAEAKRAFPKSMIVLGGPSVPRRHERARRFMLENPAIDVLAFSEGERTFCELLACVENGPGGSLVAVGGIAFRDAGAIVFTDAPTRVLQFSPMASPFLDGTFDALCDEHRERFSMALLETNRGCPFSCTFCDWSLTKQIVEFPIERVVAELEWVAERDFHHIMMADANFGIRRRDIEIAKFIAGLRERTGKPASFYFYLTKNDHARNVETIDVLQAANIGCWVGLAVQDFDDDVLEAVKRDNIQTGESMKLRDICGEREIPTFNELILGLPGQTYESFTKTVATAMPTLPRHDFVLFLCRMIDNTELGSPETRALHAIETRLCEWKTQTTDWDPVIDERQEVVVATKSMPIEDWSRAFRFSFFAAALYNLRLLRVVLHHVSRGANLRDYIEHLTAKLADAEPGTVYASLASILESYIETLLASGPFVLPNRDGAPAYVDEALAAEALRDYDRFLDESEAHTHAFFSSAPGLDAGVAHEALAGAFRYQRFITPRWQRCGTETIELEADWPSYVAGRGTPLESKPTKLRFRAPSYASLEHYADFFTTHLGCIRVRLDAGIVEAFSPNKLSVIA